MTKRTSITSLHKSLSTRSFKTKLEHYLLQESFEKGHLKQASSAGFLKFNINMTSISRVEKVWNLSDDNRIGKVQISVKELDRIIDDWKKKEGKLIEDLKAKYRSTFSKILSINQLEEITSKRSCYYCKKSEDELIEMRENLNLIRAKTVRGWTLEVDRKHPNKEYSKDNVVLACYWCNNAKTDEFSEEEFKDIGNVINRIWESRKKNKKIE